MDLIFWFSFCLCQFVNLNELKPVPSSVHSWQCKKMLGKAPIQPSQSINTAGDTAAYVVAC